MSSYRFCRTDDLALLAEAYNRCFVPHFAGCSTIGVEDLKHWSRELDLWASSCMLASSDEGPLAVLLASKREHESLILSLGVTAGHQRRGHGRHLLDSLRQKAAILGPPTLRAEVPSSWSAVREFFEACGFEERSVLRDFSLERGSRGRSPSPLAGPVTVDELDRLGLLDDIPVGVSWRRAPATLRNAAAKLGGLAVASDVRLEAFALFVDDERADERHVWALCCLDPVLREPMFRLLLDELRRHRSVRLPTVSKDEIASDLLEDLGCRAGEETVVYAAEANS